MPAFVPPTPSPLTFKPGTPAADHSDHHFSSHRLVLRNEHEGFDAYYTSPSHLRFALQSWHLRLRVHLGEVHMGRWGCYRRSVAGTVTGEDWGRLRWDICSGHRGFADAVVEAATAKPEYRCSAAVAIVGKGNCMVAAATLEDIQVVERCSLWVVGIAEGTDCFG